MTSVPVQVKATWQSFVPKGDRVISQMYHWVSDDGEPEILRGSLGESKLTVWLPSGSRVVCSRSRIPDAREKQRKFYGNYFGQLGSRRRTVFELI